MDSVLAIVILSIVGFVWYLIVTNKVTDKERDEMLDSDETWP